MPIDLFKNTDTKVTQGTPLDLFADTGKKQPGILGPTLKATGRDIVSETGRMGRDVLTKAYPPETVKQSVLGLGAGFAGFGADVYSRVAEAAKQFASGEAKPRKGLELLAQGAQLVTYPTKEGAERTAKLLGEVVDWGKMKEEGEKAAESIAYEVTDPGAQSILNAISAVPVGIKMAGHAPADLIEELAPGKFPNLVAALRTGGDLGELAAFGKVFHSIKGLKPKAVESKIAPRDIATLRKGEIREGLAAQRTMPRPFEEHITREMRVKGEIPVVGEKAQRLAGLEQTFERGTIPEEIRRLGRIPEKPFEGPPVVLEATKPKARPESTYPDTEAGIRKATIAVGGKPGIKERGIEITERKPGELGLKITDRSIPQGKKFMAQARVNAVLKRGGTAEDAAVVFEGFLRENQMLKGKEGLVKQLKQQVEAAQKKAATDRLSIAAKRRQGFIDRQYEDVTPKEAAQTKAEKTDLGREVSDRVGQRVTEAEMLAKAGDIKGAERIAAQAKRAAKEIKEKDGAEIKKAVDTQLKRLEKLPKEPTYTDVVRETHREALKAVEKPIPTTPAPAKTFFHGSPKTGLIELREGPGGEHQRVAGIYLTKTKQEALKYTKIKGKTDPKNVYAVEVDIKNPATREVLDEIGYKLTGEEMRKELIRRGYDGVIDDFMNEVVAFRPDQVKIKKPTPTPKKAEAKQPWEKTRGEFGVPVEPRDVEVLKIPHLEKKARERPEAITEADRELLNKKRKAQREHNKYLREHKKYLPKSNEHFLAVQQALKEGRKVPPEVLAEYPELKARPEEIKVAGIAEKRDYAKTWNTQLKLGRKADLVMKGKWVTGKGKMSKLGEKIAESSWGDISLAAQNVLKREIDKYHKHEITPKPKKAEAKPSPEKIARAENVLWQEATKNIPKKILEEAEIKSFKIGKVSKEQPGTSVSREGHIIIDGSDLQTAIHEIAHRIDLHTELGESLYKAGFHKRFSKDPRMKNIGARERVPILLEGYFSPEGSRAKKWIKEDFPDEYKTIDDLVQKYRTIEEIKVAEPAKEAEVAGLAYRKGKQVPFKEYREITKGPNEGKLKITWPEGRRSVIERADVVRMPEAPKEIPTVTLEALGMQTAYEKIAGMVRKDKPERVREAIRKARDDFLTPVEGNPLDKPATQFLKTEDLNEYFKAMPAMGDIKPSELFRYDPDSKAYIAQYLTKDGNLKPAVRQSGFHALKRFADAFDGAKDISKTLEQTADPTRMIQAIDQGHFGGMAQKHILWPSRMNELAKLKWSDIQKTKLAQVIETHNITNGKKAKAVGDIIEHISGNDAWGWKTEKVLNIPQVKGYLKGFKPEVKTQLVEGAMKLRQMFQNLLDNQNHARGLRKQSKIPYRGFYRPWIMETNLWSKLSGLKKKPKEVMESPELPDFIIPNQPFNPRAMARSGLMAKYPKERNIVRLMSDYIETAAKDIFDTNTVHNNKIHAQVLRGKGLEIAADAVDTFTAERFAGVSPGISRAFAKVVPPMGRKALLTIRRNLTRAVFPLNWTWNTFIQTSSAGLTYARYGAKATLAGQKYFTDPAMRQMVRQNAYSSILKSRWGGKAAYQDIQGSILKNKRLDASRIDRAEDFANFLTSSFEDALTGHAVAAAYHQGKTKFNLKGRALWEYASEGGAKTQSMYNYGDVPGILRAKEVGAVAPFQTFAFEIFNTVREMNIPGLRRVTGKAGIYETLSADSVGGKALMSNRLKMIARWTVAIAVTNAIVERAIGRKPWVPSSFLPLLSYLVGGQAGRPIAPKGYIDDFRKGVKDVIVHGSWRRLRRWAVKYNLIAGVQINRTLDGIQAASTGKVTDVRGRRMFPVRGTEERLRAITMGPYRTKAGIEHFNKIREKQGIMGALIGEKSSTTGGRAGSRSGGRTGRRAAR